MLSPIVAGIHDHAIENVKNEMFNLAREQHHDFPDFGTTRLSACQVAIVVKWR